MHKLIRVFFVVAASISFGSQSGCGPLTGASDKSLADSASREQSAASAPVVVEAGIIFANEDNYLCVPLSRFGIADSEEVLSVETSCECTQPSIITYKESPQQELRGLRIDIEPETNSTQFRSSALAVAVKIHLEKRTALATVRFLHTIRDE